MRLSRTTAALFIGTAIGLTAGSFANAEGQQQTAAPAADTGGAAAANNTTVGEVMVTARRRSENLQKVPLAVTAVSQADLTKAQVTTARQLVQFAPSLNIGTGNQRDQQRFYIRGQGLVVGVIDGPVTAYMDDAPYPQFGSGGPGFYFDMANVQVLNGPQGTLFGKNTTGGAVLFTPNRPVDTNGGWIQAGYGSYNNREVTGVLNWAVVPGKLDIRFGGEMRQRDGFTKCFYPQDTGGSCDYDNINYKVYRLGILFKPTDRIENYLALSYVLNSTNGTALNLTNFDPHGAMALTYGLNTMLGYLNLQQQLGPRVTLDTAPHSWYERNIRAVNTTTFKVTDDLSLKNIFSYDREQVNSGFDADGTPKPGLGWPIGPFEGSPSALGLEKTDYITNETQLQGKALDGKLNYTGGFFYEHFYPYVTPQGEDLEALGNVLRELQTFSGSTEAVFGQGTLDLGLLSPALDQWKLTGGVRYTWDSKHAWSNWHLLNPFFPVCTGQGVVGFYPNCNAYIDGKWNAPTFNVDLDYQVRPNALLYFTISDGFNAGGINQGYAPGEPGAVFGSEYVTNYEGGLKSDFHIGDAPVRVNLSVYHDDYSHVQRNELLPNPQGGNPINPVNSFASAVINGFELDAHAKAGRFDLSGNYDYLDAHYAGNPPNITAETGGSIRDGQQLPYAPKMKIAGTVTYHLPVPEDLGDISIYGSANYQSSFRWGDPSYIGVILGDYGLADFGANWDNIAGKPIHLQLYVTNAFDRSAVAGSLAYYNLLGFVTKSYVEPRMVGFRVRYDFGGI